MLAAAVSACDDDDVDGKMPNTFFFYLVNMYFVGHDLWW